MNETEVECYKAAGKKFQINSSVQVRTIVYDELKLDMKSNVTIKETIGKGAKSIAEAMVSRGNKDKRFIIPSYESI